MRYATQQALVSEEPDIYYPETDGKPMADTDIQRKPLTYARRSARLPFSKPT